MRIEEVFSQKNLYNYSKAFPVEPGDMSNLFPTMEITGTEVEYFINQYDRGELSTLSSFDVPATLRQRGGFDKGVASLFFFKDKYKLDEKEIMLIKHAVASPDFGKTIANIYNDVNNLNQMMENRLEWMRYQVVQTGKLVMNAENPNDVNHPLKVDIDYGVPAEHKGELDLLNETANPFEIIEGAMEKVETDTGFAPTKILTKREILNGILKNEEVRLVIRGSDKSAGYVSQAELNRELSAEGLPTIHIDEKRYKVKKPVRGKVVDTFVPYLGKDAVIFLPDSTLGHTLRGETPEEIGLDANTSARVESGSTATFTYYKEVDPVAHYVKASMTAGITFPYANQIYIGTVKRD